MEAQPTTSNVIPIKPEFTVFSKNLRSRLEEKVKLDSPQQAVDSFEQVLCVFLVSAAKKAAVKLGTALGEKLSSKR